MKYKLSAGEKLPAGMRRIARKQMDRVAELLRQGPSHGQGRSVHRARQWLKKARATLRLVRPAMGDKVWRREDRKLRTVARGLARRRDAEVLVLALETLRSGRRDAMEDRVWEKLQQIFLKQRDRVSDEARKKKRKGRVALRAARRRVGDWPLKKLRWPELCRGAGKVYREGREAMSQARRTRSTEDLHEWRKRVKDLWHGLRVLETWQPDGLAGVALGMKELSKLLGNDHDLAMLEAASKAGGLTADELKMILEPVKARRVPLQQAAFKLGKRLFAAEPKEFVRRVGDGGRKR